MAEKFRYDADPRKREQPLRQDELDALILNGAKALAKDENALVHLLHRMAATLRTHRASIGALQQDVERMAIERDSHAQPVARAMEALAALTDEQRRQLLDANYLAEVDKVQKAQADLQLARTAALNESNRVKFALAGLLEDETLPAHARQRIADAVAKMRLPGPPAAT